MRRELPAVRAPARCELLVEAIDLAPTFLEYFGGEPKPHIIEGRSLAPILEGRKDTAWRDYAISEYDYATRDARLAHGIDQADARLIMVRDRRWKYIYAEGFRPMLFDLESDPDELVDLGAAPAHEPVRQRLRNAIFSWACRHHNRTTLTPQQIERMAGTEPPGILIGFWDEEDLKQASFPASSDTPTSDQASLEPIQPSTER